MTFLIDPPVNDAEAKDVLAVAYSEVFHDFANDQNVFPDGFPNLFALGVAQAIGFMEGGPYGKWGPAGKSNNWGALTRAPNSDGSCPANSFTHNDSKFDDEAGAVVTYSTCFRKYDTSLEGAKDFLTRLYVDRPETFEFALGGDIRGVAEDMYATRYYLGTAPATATDENGDFVNVNNYIEFIGRGVNQIAHLYPGFSPDEHAPERGKSNTGLILGVTAAALVGLVVAFN